MAGLFNIKDTNRTFSMSGASGESSTTFHTSASFNILYTQNKIDINIRVIKLLDLKGVSKKYWSLE